MFQILAARKQHVGVWCDEDGLPAARGEHCTRSGGGSSDDGLAAVSGDGPSDHLDYTLRFTTKLPQSMYKLDFAFSLRFGGSF